MRDAPLEVSVQQAQRMIAERGKTVRVIDVRDPDEHQLCRIVGAELIPLATLPADAADKLPDKDAELLVYCHHGMRSLQAVRHLRDRGYTGASSMSGGIEQWATEIDPTVPQY